MNYEKLGEIRKNVSIGSFVKVESPEFNRLSPTLKLSCLLDFNPRTKYITRFADNSLNFFPKLFDSGNYTFYFYGTIEKS
jgi:hypothetical protein